MKVVISQPMFFPWVGMFEQIRLADIYAHNGGLQFSRGSFTNRVQIKTAQGIKWLTVPLQDVSLGQVIDEVKISTRTNWRVQHMGILKQAYLEAPYCKDMLALVDSVYQQQVNSIGILSRLSMEACYNYFGFDAERRFIDIRQLEIGGSSSQRALDMVRSLGGTIYITGLGARNYLDHQLFEDAGIRVEYMDYQKRPYPQLNGEFTPYVSILDLIANTGKEGINWIQSGTVYWKDYLKNE
jgi:hypothetical protein